MRILLIGPYAPHGQVGAIRVLSLSRHLLSVGHEVSVLCLSEECIRSFDPKGLSASVPEGVKVYTYDISINNESYVKRNAINEKQFNLAFHKLLMQRKFDVVILSVGPFYTLRPMRQLKTLGIPYIVDYRDLNISSPDKRKRNGIVNKIKMIVTFPNMYFREKRCLSGALYVTVVAPEMKKNMARFFGIDERKFTVVYNGYDDVALEGLALRAPTADQYTIGYFGKLMYYNKDLTEMLFSALEEINKQEVQVRFLHIGPENQDIQTYFNDTKMNKHGWYVCAGQKSYKEGMELLSSCNACALEYAYPEGPGTKIFDYIFLNKPVIGVTRPGISLEKLLKKFDHAFICHDTQKIVDAIRTLLDNKNMRLVDKNTEIITEFSRNKQNSVFSELLEEIGQGK